MTKAEDEEKLNIRDVEMSDVEDVPQNEYLEEVASDDNESDYNDEEEETAINLSVEKFISRDGTEWNAQPNDARQALVRNIVRQRCGASKHTEMMSMEQTYKCFMSSEMVDIIMRHTNKKAINSYKEWNESHPNSTPKVWEEVTVAELYAFFGILIMAGTNRSSTESVRHLWSARNFPLYRAVMGNNRFCALLAFIRFDDANTRAIRIQTDKAAPIRHYEP